MDGLTFREIHLSRLLDNALDNSQHVAVSPDGRDVYATSRNNDTVIHFQRRADGTLEFVTAVAALPNSIPTNYEIGHLAVSPNGRFVYVGFDRQNSVEFAIGLARLDRNSSDGTLTAGDAAFATPENDLDVMSVVLAPNGEFAYLLARRAGIVAVFVIALDPELGTMSGVQTLVRQPSGSRPIGLNAIQMVASPNGNNLYVAAPLQGGIEIYDVDQTSGEVSFVELVTSVELDIPQSVAVSPDGAQVYVADSLGGAIHVFSRDAAGNLTPPMTNEGIVALTAVTRIMASADGNRVYTLSFGQLGGFQAHVSAYARDPESGALTLLETILDGFTGSAWFSGNDWPALSPDAQSLYLPASFSNVLAVFSTVPTSLPCVDFTEIRTSYDDLKVAYDLPDDVDFDALPEIAALALIEEISCNSEAAGLSEATTNAYLINLESSDREGLVADTKEWIPYQKVLASLLLTSAAMRNYLNVALEPFQLALFEPYVPVVCAEGTCEPSAARAADEPFSSEGDPDVDGATNAEEWANVLARGGDVREFAVSALDPANDGTIEVFFGGGDGGGCFIATAAYGTPLAGELDSLRAFRDTHLLTNPLGAAFADAYYRLSPPIAGYLADHPRLRAVIRFGLRSFLHNPTP